MPNGPGFMATASAIPAPWLIDAAGLNRIPATFNGASLALVAARREG
jgi:hypothetical protein